VKTVENSARINKIGIKRKKSGIMILNKGDLEEKEVGGYPIV
jgi:hypothetical protein